MSIKSGVVYVEEKGKVLKHEFYGYRDLPNKLEHNERTSFPTASFGKIFVAVGILKLIEEAHLSLDSTLGELVSFELNQIDPTVTVQQLLTHTSGVPDYCDEEIVPDYAELWNDYPNYKVRTSRDLLPLFIEEPMKYQKGDKFEYNNSGFVLLGLIIEEITKLPVDKYLEKVLFSPLDMKHTGYYALDRLPGNCALGYIHNDDSYHSFIYSVDVKGSGAGGAFTNPIDLSNFWDGLMNYRILSQETIEKMMVRYTDWNDGGYGLGVWLDKDDNPYIVGSDPGVECISWYNPKIKKNITVISNMEDNVYEEMRKYN